MQKIENKIVDKEEYAEIIKDDLHKIIEAIVDKPEVVKYKLFPLETRLIIEIFAYSQSKFILGHSGSTMNHIRELLKIISKKHKGSPFRSVQVNLEYTGNIKERE